MKFKKSKINHSIYQSIYQSHHKQTNKLTNKLTNKPTNKHFISSYSYLPLLLCVRTFVRAIFFSWLIIIMIVFIYLFLVLQ